MAVLKSTVRLTVADPNAAYLSMVPVWAKNRAVCGGAATVKEFDDVLDIVNFTNLLVPFSPKMDASQYSFYKAEAELPGIVSEYARLLVGALLRKEPSLTLPDSVNEEARNWIKNEFAEDSSNLQAFLNEVMLEELITQRAWVFVDYPEIPESNLSKDEAGNYKPYPVIWRAENIINWRTERNSYGQTTLTQVITREFIEKYGEKGSNTEFHPKSIEQIRVHEIVDGKYQVRIFESENTSDTTVSQGAEQSKAAEETPKLSLVGEEKPLFNDEQLSFIPAWPLNGSIDIVSPIMTPLIDKEIALYNKLSRRNHLLYGAATYTPWIADDMTDDEFQAVSNAGLGRWIKLSSNGKCGVLQTPTEALSDLQSAIEGNMEEMAKLGVRMLSPENSQSGVALNLRNASQTAKLGSLNNRASATLRAVITFMLNWRYDLDLKVSDVQFSMSPDFSPAAIGEVWLKLVTQWYQDKLVPRSVFLKVLSDNDMLPENYDDSNTKQEIASDTLLPDEMIDLAGIGNPSDPFGNLKRPKPKETPPS
jgi:hypothetical protein